MCFFYWDNYNIFYHNLGILGTIHVFKYLELIYKNVQMKTLIKSSALAVAGLVSFSFTTLDDQTPKVVIVDIVDNIETTNNQNITQTFRQQIEKLNQDETVKIVEWKKIADGLDDAKKKEILDSIKPEVILTVNFKNTTDGNNTVTAVVSKNNQHFDHSLGTARNLTASFDTTLVKNGGVFQAESEYIQDNFAPAMFVSIETKNDQQSNTEIVETLSQYIKDVKVETTEETSPQVKSEDVEID